MAMVEVDEPGSAIRVVRLNRPDRLNAMSIDLAVELDEVLAEVGRDNECRVVILTARDTPAFDRRGEWGRLRRRHVPGAGL